MKVAVLMGGNSSERDVSLSTGKAVAEALGRTGMDVFPCPFEGNVRAVLPFLRPADVVFNGLHGGAGENGTVQRILEDAGMKYTGSGPEASALAMDKQRTKLLLKENGFPTPRWLHLETGTHGDVDLESERFTFPVVVKPNDDGSTMGVSIVQEAHELDGAVRLAREFGSEVLIEEFIPGQEITVGILGNKALPVIEIIPVHELYDYACKYTEGLCRYVCPAGLPSELAADISRTAERIAALLGCRHYCRVDFRLNPEEEFFCLEVNTLPGFTGTSLVPKAAMAVGISFDDLVRTIVEYATHE
ncbi:MAG: D-alanine--D-alanine ligase [Fidelibacterota bacterium]